MAGPLQGLRVVDLTDGVAGAHCAQALADFGAEVALVEPPGGRALRHSAAFPFLARGCRSIVLEPRDPRDRDTFRGMVAAADVLLESFTVAEGERLGLAPADTAALNPGLVHVSITAFGRTGPLADLPVDDALVMAKIGGSHTLSTMTAREGPAYAAVPFASYSAAQTALQGLLAALLERDHSGSGQFVETSLVQAIAGHDIWSWFLNLLTTRYSGAFTPAPHVQDGVPNSALIYRLLVALSADGRWLQFSQTSRHLYVALMRALGLDWMFDDPAWGEDLPLVANPRQRVELWDRMVTEVRARTSAEWSQVFDEQPNVWAEPFRYGRDLLDHPQLRHDRNVVTLVDPVLGPVEQPGPLVAMAVTPADLGRPAPTLDADTEAVRAWRPVVPSSPQRSSADAPLAGVTVLELGMFFAGPYAGSLLADLGARVIKVEPPAGDPMRSLASFPEIGAIKVTQGKDCIAVDLGTEEGRRIVHDLARDVDVVIQSFRAGVAERLGVDGPTLTAINPDLVYLNAPGYGVDGPCGHRPAYAPTIAAASGIAWRMAGATMPAAEPLPDLEATKDAALRLVAATNASFAQCDGLSALSVASSALLGLLARRRGAGGQQLWTSMLNFAAHLNCEDVVRYADRPPTPAPDPELYGLSARHRLYRCAEGWVFLAAATDMQWAELLGTEEFAHVGDAGDLADVFLLRPAGDWEKVLRGGRVGCVAVTEDTVEGTLMGDDVGRACGLVTEVEHPMLGEHPRLAPLVRFSRSATTPGPGAMVGQHTEQVLRGLGYPPEYCADLRTRGIVVT
jgi:crotonobetainyl-CoA:carnitine CoA-transferase CaiB-like acyl-CoA transferase